MTIHIFFGEHMDTIWLPQFPRAFFYLQWCQNPATTSHSIARHTVSGANEHNRCIFECLKKIWSWYLFVVHMSTSHPAKCCSCHSVLLPSSILLWFWEIKIRVTVQSQWWPLHLHLEQFGELPQITLCVCVWQFCSRVDQLISFSLSLFTIPLQTLQ